MSQTPKSDEALRQFGIFTESVHARLLNGKREYGDSSFDRPMLEIMNEIQQELEDVCGWGFIQWSRLEAMKRRLSELAPT